MVDARKVPQVEDVVEFGGRRGQVSDNELVELHCGCGEDLGEVLESWRRKERSLSS